MALGYILASVRAFKKRKLNVTCRLCEKVQDGIERKIVTKIERINAEETRPHRDM